MLYKRGFGRIGSLSQVARRVKALVVTTLAGRESRLIGGIAEHHVQQEAFRNVKEGGKINICITPFDLRGQPKIHV